MTNRLVGKILGHPRKLLEIYEKKVVKTHLLTRLLGVKGSSKNKVHVGEIKMYELLHINAGSTSIVSLVKDIKGEKNDKMRSYINKSL